MTLAWGHFLARRAEGKDKAKMAGGGGNDVRMADAAGSAGNGENGAGSQAGPAGPFASGDSASRRAGSSADNGRDMRGGGAHTGYPNEADDQ